MGKKGTCRNISKEEFCKETHTRSDCWIFDEIKQDRPYWKSTLEGREDQYHIRNGNEIYTFKDMPQYHEIWVIRKNIGSDIPAGLWSTWTEY